MDAGGSSCRPKKALPDCRQGFFKNLIGINLTPINGTHFSAPLRGISTFTKFFLKNKKRISKVLKTHSQLVIDHDDAFDVTVGVTVFKKITGIHESEMHFIGEVVEELIDNADIGLPAGVGIQFY